MILGVSGHRVAQNAPQAFKMGKKRVSVIVAAKPAYAGEKRRNCKFFKLPFRDAEEISGIGNAEDYLVA